jgi:hypothetical protein
MVKAAPAANALHSCVEEVEKGKGNRKKDEPKEERIAEVSIAPRNDGAVLVSHPENENDAVGMGSCVTNSEPSLPRKRRSTLENLWLNAKDTLPRREDAVRNLVPHYVLVAMEHGATDAEHRALRTTWGLADLNNDIPSDRQGKFHPCPTEAHQCSATAPFLESILPLISAQLQLTEEMFLLWAAKEKNPISLLKECVGSFGFHHQSEIVEEEGRPVVRTRNPDH